jgi:hypothetical protein
MNTFLHILTNLYLGLAIYYAIDKYASYKKIKKKYCRLENLYKKLMQDKNNEKSS